MDEEKEKKERIIRNKRKKNNYIKYKSIKKH